MLTPTVTPLSDLPSAHAATAGLHVAAPAVFVAMERVVRPRPERKGVS